MARSNATTAAAELTLILKQLSGNSARRQRQRLLAAMLEFGSVTTVDATRFLDIIDPRARIFELRRQGYRISTMPVARATECGVVHVVGSYLYFHLFRKHQRLRTAPTGCRCLYR